MPRLTWKDGDTHEFVVIGKVGSKRHYNKSQNRFILCTGRSSCWFCQHGFDREGVVIGIAVYSPAAIEESHFPWVSFTPVAYAAIKRILGPTNNWYGHRVQLTRKGESFDTTYSAKDLGVVEDHKLEKWVEERGREISFDAGEGWGKEEPREEILPMEEEPPLQPPEPEEDKEGELVMLKDYIKNLEERLDELAQEKGKPEGEE